MPRPLAATVFAALSIASLACATSPKRAETSNTAVASSASRPAMHWAYDGSEGPAHWGELAPEFSRCASGRTQSPIDLPAAVGRTPSPILTLPRYPLVPLRAKNNGHSLEVDVDAHPEVVFGGEYYALQQFHFHVPAEHTIAGKRFAVELHLVHRSQAGHVLVIGILLQKGGDNRVLASLLEEIPHEAGRERVVETGRIDVQALFPQAPRFMSYEGSLTTPPCTEGVHWFLLERQPAAPLEVSDSQIERLRTALHGDTNRPSAPLNGRSVSETLPVGSP